MILPKRKLKRNLKNNKFFKKLVIFIFFLLQVGIIFIILFTISIFNKEKIISPVSLKISISSLQNNSEDQTLKVFKEILNKHNISYLKINSLQNDTIEVYLSSNKIAYFSLRKDLNDQITSLQLITSRLTMEGREFKKIYLQFDKPVITYN